MQHVIIGSGPAGVVASETLRKVQPNADITLIGDEPEPPYSRMAIPYLLIDKIKENGTYLRKTDGHYQQKQINVVQSRVSSIDANNKQVSFDDGREPISYDKLLIATGASAMKPPIPGLDLPGVASCWTLADARKILERAKPGANVTLIGAGFVGCIVLEALGLAGVNLTVIERGDRMVPRMLDEVAGNMVKRWCVNKGVQVHTSAQVESIEQKGGEKGGFFSKIFGGQSDEPKGLVVNLADGTVIEADLVVTAIGVISNIGFLKATDIKTDVGILVNEFMQTNVPDIYAAGDVAQGRDFSTGEFSVQAIQPTAVEHGRVAAMNMAGHPVKHEGTVNMNVLDTLGLISSSFGLWEGVEGGDRATLVDQDRNRYINLCFEGDVLVGGQSVGLTQHVGVLRGLIQNRTPMGAWKDRLMKDPTRIMEAYLALMNPVIPSAN